MEEGARILADVLKFSEPRPSVNAVQAEKNKYAIRFADKMAELIARDLGPHLKGIEATTKRGAGSVRGKKQLDVNFSTPHLGLALGISLKSVHLRDPKSQRYTHNMKRNEEELRIEATGYHKRQPYAVMVGVLFLPFDSCQDGRKENPSSFGSWVRHLRPYGARVNTTNDSDRFEKIYIALYEPDGTSLRFFDTELDPPKNRKPSDLMSYRQFLNAVYHIYLRRNSADFRWADGEEAPLEVNEPESEYE